MIKCQKCGHCCRTFPIDIAYSDIKRWREENRMDILMEISFINNYPARGYAGFYIEKSLRNPKRDCPFFIDGECSIYETRPMVCMDFPLSKKVDDAECPEHKNKYPGMDEIIKNQDFDFKLAIDRYNEMMAALVKARK